MNDTLMEKINKYIEPETVELIFGEGSDSFVVKINSEVSSGMMSAIIERIAMMVKWNGFTYDLFDILLAYYVISLFTDIPIPTKKDKDEKTIEDYEKCYTICTSMNLIDEICHASPTIAAYIEFIEKNVWRKLEYYKTVEANEKLMALSDKAYGLLDTLEDAFDNVTPEMFSEIVEGLKLVSENPSLIEN